MQKLSCSCLLMLPLVCSTSAGDEKVLVTVLAGDHERTHTVVGFNLPAQSTGARHVRDARGNLLPLQVEKDRQVSFIVPQLKRGDQAAYELVSGGSQAQGDGVQAKRDGTKAKIGLRRHPLLEYQAEPGDLPRDDIKPLFKRGGYIHPIYTWKGKLVTDDFPPNHVHHHGVWWAWTKTEFEGRQPDFWNMGQGKGRVEFVELGNTWSGPVHGGFTARHQFVDLTGPKSSIALNEMWDVRAYERAEGQPFWIFDLTSTQTCATTNALKLPEYLYGGIGWRGIWAWNGKDKCSFLTSDGEADRVKAHAARARWCDMWGQVDDAEAGLAILCHPENFRAPQPMRVHPSEPFFCYAPQQIGDMEIAPGKPYVSRYRFVIHDGPPDKEVLNRIWNDYAHPPEVRIEVK